MFCKQNRLSDYASLPPPENTTLTTNSTDTQKNLTVVSSTLGNSDALFHIISSKYDLFDI